MFTRKFLGEYMPSLYLVVYLVMEMWDLSVILRVAFWSTNWSCKAAHHNPTSSESKGSSFSTSSPKCLIVTTHLYITTQRLWSDISLWLLFIFLMTNDVDHLFSAQRWLIYHSVTISVGKNLLKSFAHLQLGYFFCCYSSY